MFELMFVKVWPWWVGGPALGLFVLSYMLFQNRLLGASSTFQAVTEMIKGKGDPNHPHFPLNIEVGDLPVGAKEKSPRWRVVFFVGLICGGLISGLLMGAYGQSPQLEGMGEFLKMGAAGQMLMLAIGGIFVGFGTRFCGGCTSGHAIVGISGRQLPSLIATMLFFGTGMATTFLLAWLRG